MLTNTAFLAAAISGIVSLAVAIVTHVFTKSRDRESDWRKLKLDGYKEFIAALSENVHSGRSRTSQLRYSNAVNGLILIASPEVLNALYQFVDETSYKNAEPNIERYERKLSELARAMRSDCHPQQPDDDPTLLFRTISVPPDEHFKT